MRILAAAGLSLLLVQPPAAPSILPETAVARLVQGLDAARAQRRNVWRDTRAIHSEGTVTAYVEIPRGDRRKWEFDIARNRRIVDRVLPREVGGYPINYGFVPQTISFDGDPVDALVLGRALRGGALIRGEIVAIMHMEDEQGLDSKIVLSPVMVGKRLHDLTDADRARLTAFFAKYKAHEPGAFSRVTGWGSPEEGLSYARQTHAFFTAKRGS